MRRIVLFAPLCVLALTFAACEGNSGSNDGGTGGNGGSGGSGATGGTGAMGGLGGSDGGKCPSSPITPAPIDSIVIPGHGQVWPPSENAGGAGNAGGSGNLGGAGGVGGASSGCTVTRNEKDDSTHVECHGLAQITRHTEVEFLDAEFDDGSSARFVVPGAIILPESGKVDLELVASQAPLPPPPDDICGVGVTGGPTIIEQTSRARDEDGKLLWVVGQPTAEEREEIFGAPVGSVKSCSDTYEDSRGTFTQDYFDHVVKSEPEQRIPAAEPTTIHTDGRSYQVTWFETGQTYISPVDVCVVRDAPPGAGFLAVLKPE